MGIETGGVIINDINRYVPSTYCLDSCYGTLERIDK
jgi:hypothetical protein